ncbi:Rne/Rng family ribonuclease [Sphingomonas sp.]|uniref:Rne/Rng family ribonuclease n=1 Tax=Sphingomonas sp. TaxID=28214 RepID=UPI0035BBE835
MLIDARHREETRIAVVKGNRIEEFDFESAERKQLKGNIYLAKVTRVEPSLQAAFIDYGGNRHGFLAFSEIHPDYYQIPKEDRDALLREEAEHAAEEAELRARQDAEDDEHGDEGHGDDEHGDDDHGEEDHADDLDEDHGDHGDGHADDQDEAGGDAEAPRPPKTAVNDDQVEALRTRRMNLRRRYKIQDVIRRRQVLLVQVVKEERGNKGAALTTYLSLAGRYCVLMPNTSHGGGISRKISNAGDRKRLKTIMADLALPSSMGCIVRTAGLQRTKVEIKRDFDYLARLWDGIREETLKSAAPAVVYGDSDLIKRAIRDIYNKDVEEVIVEGEEGYRQAKEFMRLLMPSHARKVKHYSDPIPLFQRAHVEDQLAAMYNPVVQLKSGGYLVINPTEALVSIDINSGRSTREHNIEQTATATNLEATAEIARQLRLRDMAGLVVIDFIDMDNNGNVRKVEKAMKEALKDDRARIQVGRISSFGLMEMSRQRLRTGVLEASTRQCPHCEGTGLVRTASSAGLSALRLIEDEAARGRGSLICLRASQEAAIYVLNRKRADIAEIEDRYGVSVEIFPDREEEGARMSVEASGPPPAYAPRFDAPMVEEIEDDIPEEIEGDEIDAGEEFAEDEAVEARAPRQPRDDAESDEAGRKRRRRRRGRGKRREEGDAPEETVSEAGGDDESDEPGDVDAAEDSATDEAGDFAGEQPVETAEGARRRRGRRGRRGGRRSEGGEGALEAPVEAEGVAVADVTGDVMGDEPGSEPELPIPEPVADAEEPVAEQAPAPVADEAPKTRRRPRARAATAATDTVEEVAAPAPEAEADAAPKPRRGRRKPADAAPAEAPAEDVAAEEPAAKPRRRTRRKPVDADAGTDVGAEPVANAADAGPIVSPLALAAEPEPDAEPAPEDTAASSDEAGAPRRGGWWQRTFGA